MAITQVDTENADRDLTSQVTVLTDTPDASNNVICQALIMFGDGTKNLDGTGGDFELEISVAGNTVQPAPQVVTFGTDVRASVWTTAFPVPANTEVVIKATSPNAADTDVDVTAYLYDVSAPSAAAVLAAFGTGSTLSSCATATGFSTHSAAAVYTAFGDGSNLSTCATATGFSTHSAADVYTAFGDGSNLSTCATATGFSTHDAADVVTAIGTGSTLTACITATGFSTHSAADVYTAFGTGSDLTACITAVGFSTHAAADVWAVGTRILTASTNFNDLSAANVTTACTSSLNSYDPPTKGEMDTMEVNLTAEIDANETKIDALENISAADVNAQCDASIETYGLDHLLSAALADDGDIVDNSAIAQLAATAGDFSTFSKATDSLQSIRDATGSLGGSGAVTDTFTIEEPVGTPEAGVDVWISTDEAGTNVIAGTLVSDVSGEVEFSLDETTGLWVHVQKSGINFTGYPKEFDVLVGGFSWA